MHVPKGLIPAYLCACLIWFAVICLKEGLNDWYSGYPVVVSSLRDYKMQVFLLMPPIVLLVLLPFVGKARKP